MTLHPPPPNPDLASPIQPRARGRVHVGLRVGRLKDLHQSGSLKAVFPHGQTWPQVVLVNTAGGITGGDQFESTLDVQTGSKLTLTTQAAERVYAAQPGSCGSVTNHATVHAGAHLEWLPQETIFFQSGALCRRQRFDLSSAATALIVEPLIFGRPAMGEVVTDAYHRDDLTVYVDGSLAFRDAFTLTGSNITHLRDQGFGAMAAVHLFGAGVAHRLDGVRDRLDDTSGATALDDDLITCRILAADGFSLRQTLVPVIQFLTQDALPKVWRL